jgi:hypothetical protein
VTVTSLHAVMTASAAQGAIMDRHAELQRVLDEWAGTLVCAVEHATPTAPAVRLLRAFLAGEVLPHLRAEEQSLYPAAARQARTELLVRSLVSENRSIAWHASQAGDGNRAGRGRDRGGDQVPVRGPCGEGGLPPAAGHGTAQERPGSPGVT